MAENAVFLLTVYTDFLLSASKTLESISVCCHLGSFADANTLVRKYRDDIFLYLYIIEASINRKGLTAKEQDDILNGEMTIDKFLEVITLTFSILSSSDRKDKHDNAVDAWFDNTAENGNFRKMLDIKNYIDYLR